MTVLPSGTHVSIHLIDTADGGPLGVARVDPSPDPARTFVVAMGFGAHLDAFELQRFTVLAHTLRARLLVVETPGCSATPTALRYGERRALLQADFGPVAARMLTAALTVDDTGHPRRDLGVLGYSLGASVAAAMARAGTAEGPRSGTLASLVLVEPVADRRWSGPQLFRAMRTEDALIDGYLRTNADVPGAVLPSDRTPGAPRSYHRRLDQLLFANALRSGRLIDDVRAAAANNGRIQVVVAHGASSHLSRPADASRLTDQCRQSGIRSEDVTVPGHHGLWQSLPAVHDLGVQIGSMLDRSAACDR